MRETKEGAKTVELMRRAWASGGEQRTTSRFARTEDQIQPKTSSPSVTPVTPQLTVSEKSKLMVIRREVGRGFAISRQDMKFLCGLTERVWP